MSAKREVTLNQLLDDAIERLPLVRRRVMQIRMRNPRARQRVLNEVQLSLYEDPRAAAFGLQPVFGDDSFTADTPFQIDVDNLERILKLIVEYLPQIIQLITALFGSALLLVALSASTASAVELNPLALAEIHFASLQTQSVQQPPVEIKATCSCKTTGNCTCTNCQCVDCPCKATIKQSLTVDEMTGIPIEGNIVIMLTSPGCQPCEAWRLSAEPQVLKDQGYRVFVHSDTEKHVNVRSYPTFIVYRSGLRSIIEGPIKAVRQAIAAPVRAVQAVRTVSYQPSPPPMLVQSPYYSTEELRQQIRSHRPGLQTYASDAYMARGSDVYQHLVSSEHGFTPSQVNGLTRQEANVLHALAPNHQGLISPRRSVQSQFVATSIPAQRYQPQQVVQYAMSNCAFGNCAGRSR